MNEQAIFEESTEHTEKPPCPLRALWSRAVLLAHVWEARVALDQTSTRSMPPLFAFAT
jgi:hypothetical protein